jgi:DNA-binding response OmpR family regulator
MSGGETVLVLEDNRDIRAFVRSALDAGGFTVIEVQTGWQALREAEGHPPDVLLLDWQPPDISGLMCCVRCALEDATACHSDDGLRVRRTGDDCVCDLVCGII